MIICERIEPFKLPIATQVSCKTNINQQTLVAKTQGKHILTFASKNCIAKSLKQIKLPHHTKDTLHAIIHIHVAYAKLQKVKNFYENIPIAETKLLLSWLCNLDLQNAKEFN